MAYIFDIFMLRPHYTLMIKVDLRYAVLEPHFYYVTYNILNIEKIPHTKHKYLLGKTTCEAA